MIKQFIKGRVCIFIDAENVFYSQRTLGWKISYQKLIDYLKKECGDKTECFIYKGVDEFNIEQRKFLDMLEINGYIVRTNKRTLITPVYAGSNDFSLALA